MVSKIIGLDSLKRKLAALPIAAQKRIREAMAQGADQIVAMMKRLAPTDSGDLQKSIGWTWGKAPKGMQAIASVRSSDSAQTITIYAGSADAYYARWVEFGTAASAAQAPRQNRNYRRTVVLTKGSAGHTATPAQPFFYVSYRSEKRSVKSRITRAITKSAKEVAGRS